MTTNTTQTSETRASPWRPVFDAPPGQGASGKRAWWELVQWLVELNAAQFCIVFLLSFVPGYLGTSVLVIGFLAVAVSDGTISVLDRKRAVHALKPLPLHSRAMASLLWAMAVLALPLAYICVQIPVRLVAIYSGIGDLGWFASIVPESVAAAGLAAMAFLGRLTVLQSAARVGIRRNLIYMLGQVLLAMAYFSPFGIGWILNREAGIREPSYLGTIAAAVILVLISYRLAPHVWNAIGQTGQASFVPTRGARSAKSPLRILDFLGLWFQPLLRFGGWVTFMCVAMIAMPYLVAGQANLDSDYPLIVFGMAPFLLLSTYFQQSAQVDYRLIRCLPLRRSRQVLLILSFGLPLILPVSALVVGFGLVFDWPLGSLAALLIALAGAYEFALVFWPSIGCLAVFAAGTVSTLLVFVASSWHSPWALALYTAFAGVLLLGAYAYLYQQLCGDGALYGKRDVIDDVVVGRV